MSAFAVGGARGIGRDSRVSFQSTEGSRIAALVSRCAARFRDAIRYARSCTTRTQDNERARAVAKRTLPAKPLNASLEHTTLLLVDCAARGAAVQAEAALEELRVAIRATRGDVPLPTFREAHLAEEQAEAAREYAETALAHENTPENRDRFIRASAEYDVAADTLDAVVRAMGATL